MVSNDFLVEESVKNYKKFKKSRKFISRFTTAGILASCILVGAVLPLLFMSVPVVVTALPSVIAASLNGIGVIKSCLIGGAVGAAVGGIASFVKQKYFDYFMRRDANDTLRGIAEARQAKYLEQIANKNQISVCSPQELDGRSSERERLLK